MANFALLNDNNIVTNIITINNQDIIDENGNESEELGIKICQSHFPETRWVQTSYNSKMRGSYACIGDYYNEEYDVFCAPRPYNSWIFNPEFCRWDPPVSPPEMFLEGYTIAWNEEQRCWDTIEVPKPFISPEVLSQENLKIEWICGEWVVVPNSLPEPPQEPQQT